MGVATDCSTASADAPGYVAVTRMFGGARNGYCSMARPLIVTTPSMTVRIEMTMATIGRRMKNCAMGYFPPAFLVGVRSAGFSGTLVSAFAPDWPPTGASDGLTGDPG